MANNSILFDAAYFCTLYLTYVKCIFSKLLSIIILNMIDLFYFCKLIVSITMVIMET